MYADFANTAALTMLTRGWGGSRGSGGNCFPVPGAAGVRVSGGLPGGIAHKGWCRRIRQRQEVRRAEHR